MRGSVTISASVLASLQPVDVYYPQPQHGVSWSRNQRHAGEMGDSGLVGWRDDRSISRSPS
jgi:hypothetical protein